jgi:hypothetical protein
MMVMIINIITSISIFIIININNITLMNPTIIILIIGTVPCSRVSPPQDYITNVQGKDWPCIWKCLLCITVVGVPYELSIDAAVNRACKEWVLRANATLFHPKGLAAKVQMCPNTAEDEAPQYVQTALLRMAIVHAWGGP